MGLSREAVKRLYAEHIDHCTQTHGASVLLPECDECVSYCARTLVLAGRTPDDVLKDNSFPVEFKAMAEAIKRRENRGSAWD